MLLVVKKIYLTKYRFFGRLYRDKISRIDIIQALTTDGVKFVIAIKNIRNMIVMYFVFRFEVFNLSKNIPKPVITKPDVCA